MPVARWIGKRSRNSSVCPDVDAYRLVLDENAAMTLVTASRAEQHKVGGLLDRMKSTPFRAGDFQQRDANGRLHEVLLQDDWLVTYWCDHAVREIRIVELERVED